MTDPFAGDNELYEVVKASPVRIFLANVFFATATLALGAAVTAWWSGESFFLATAPLGGFVVAAGMALRHRNASLERVEGTLWGPAAGGWLSSDPQNRARIRLEEIDRNARPTWGLLWPLFGWRRICGHGGQEIRYCRLWYDPTDLDTFLMRLGLG